MRLPQKPIDLLKLQTASDLSSEDFHDFFQAPRLSKPEMHLLLKPYFVLDRHAERFKPIEYEYTTLENGKVFTRIWWVQPHPKYGLPGPFDRDVCIVIHEIVNEQYLSRSLLVPATMPIGTLREFAKRMQIAPSGQNLAAIKESLNRLKNTLIDAQETFFDNKKKRYVSLRITLLRGFILAGQEDENGTRYEQNYVMFDETILSNLNTGYVMVIDVDSLRKLKSNIGKQLRTHLVYRFHLAQENGQDFWLADYDWLAMHLGIKPQTELWRAKQQLEHAHEELKATEYLASYDWDGWRVIYRPGNAWKGEQLRRRTGKAKHAGRESSAAAMSLLTNEPNMEHDPLIPALVAFASGLSVGEERIRALGLTAEEATALCEERNIFVKKH